MSTAERVAVGATQAPGLPPTGASDPGGADGCGPGLATPTSDLTEAVWGLIGAVRRLRARRPSGDGELGTSELRILGQLGALQAPTAIGEVGRLVGLNPATTSATVDRLESAGLVERARDTADRRVVRVVLTAEGSETVRRRVSAWQDEWADALAALPEDDIEVTARTLRAVARAVDAR